MDPEDRREFKCGDVVWFVTRDTGVRMSASAGGFYPPSGRRGLYFVASGGERRFLAMGTMELPDRDELRSLPEERLCELVADANVET